MSYTVERINFGRNEDATSMAAVSEVLYTADMADVILRFRLIPNQ